MSVMCKNTQLSDLALIGLGCGAVSMFALGMKTSDKFWRITFLVIAALNTVLIVSHFLF
jgi:hypothetical protein